MNFARGCLQWKKFQHKADTRRFVLFLHFSHEFLQFCSPIFHLLREILSNVDVAASQELGLSELVDVTNALYYSLTVISPPCLRTSGSKR